MSCNHDFYPSHADAYMYLAGLGQDGLTGVGVGRVSGNTLLDQTGLHSDHTEGNTTYTYPPKPNKSHRVIYIPKSRSSSTC